MRVKICGLRDLSAIDAAVNAGAAYVGFVFFPASPRHVDWLKAADLMAAVRPGVCKVGLVVDPDEATLAQLDAVPLDMLQLHGKETPERVLAIRSRLGLPVMKAVGIATAEDLGKLDDYEAVADQILCDAKPARGPLPGGTGLSFDWRLIAGRRWCKPWMLAGGLSPENVAEAVAMTGASQLDVSSGVEDEPGIKSPAKIEAFLTAAKAA